MTDPAFPSSVTPPPLPPVAPRPVLPLEPGPFPPPLPGPEASLPGGPFYKPPVFFETPTPAAAGGSSWALWGIGAVVVLIVGAGLGFMAAVRSGPSAAAARGAPTPPPKWKPVTTPTTPAPAAPAVTRPPQERMTATPRSTAPSSSYPLVTLPAERQIDLQLKTLWQSAETAGLTTKTIKTQRSVRRPDFSLQPMQVELSGAYPQVVMFLQSLRSSMPAAVVESLDVSGTPDVTGKSPLRVQMTVNLYFAPDAGGAFAGGAPLYPHPDLAGCLVEVAKFAESKMQFTRVAVKIDGAADAPGTPLRPKVTLDALAQSDVDVASLMHRLSGSRRVKEHDLIKSETQSFAGQSVRAFQIQFVIPAPEMRAPVQTVAPVALSEILDPFAAPAWLRSSTARPAQSQVEPPRPVAVKPAPAPARPIDVSKALQGIALESVTTGRTPGCVINGRFYRVGHTVNALTIEAINPDGIVLRHENQRFEVKLKKP